MKEQWLTVVGYEGLYAVSAIGRVMNLTTGKVLDGGLSSQEYRKVKLTKDGVEKDKLVHVLMAEAFLGPRPDGARVVHLNGDKADNRLANIRYQIADARKAQLAYQRYIAAEKRRKSA